MPPRHPFDQFDDVDNILPLAELDQLYSGKNTTPAPSRRQSVPSNDRGAARRPPARILLYPKPTPDAVDLATGPTRLEHVRTPQMQTAARMVAAGKSAAEVRVWLARQGIDPNGVRGIDAAVRVRRSDPKARSDAWAERYLPQTRWNRFTASPSGAAMVGALNGTSLGFLDEGTGAIDSLISGRTLRDAIAEQDARKQALANANPKSYFAGNLAGSLLVANPTGKVAETTLGAAGLAGRLGRATPFVGDAELGVIGGAGDSNDNRLGGALLGATFAPAGRYMGEAAAIPVGVLARSRPGAAGIDAMRSVSGRKPLVRPEPLLPGAVVDDDVIAVLKGDLLPRDDIERTRPTRSLGLFGGAAAGAAAPFLLPALPDRR